MDRFAIEVPKGVNYIDFFNTVYTALKEVNAGSFTLMAAPEEKYVFLQLSTMRKTTALSLVRFVMRRN